jgi:hypothetical protein
MTISKYFIYVFKLFIFNIIVLEPQLNTMKYHVYIKEHIFYIIL